MLYRIGTKRDLAKLLGISLPQLKRFLPDDNFKEWTTKDGRLIEEAHPPLAAVLSKLHKIISKIETPPYLFSGKKGIKARNNAELHYANGYMVNVDISRFYQSTKREFVYLVFKDTFGQTPDVASMLATLVTYKGHIPTGTATSQAIAYWAYKKTFDRISKLCAANEVLMSVWVDDITFSSSKPFPRGWVRDIRNIVRDVELSLKASKTKKYKISEYRTVTGSALSPDGEILVKNEKRKEILDLCKGKTVDKLNLQQARSLFGKLTSQRQNEPHFFSNMYGRCRARLRDLERQRAKRKKARRNSKVGKIVST